MGAIEGGTILRAADGGGLAVSVDDGQSWGHVSGVIAVATETELAAVNIAHMTLGTFAYVTSEALYFQLVQVGPNMVWQQVVFGSSGTTRSAATATPVTSLSIDVSADGDGLYEFEFNGTILSSGTNVFFKLQANGADLPSAAGSYKEFLSAGGISAAGASAVGNVARGQNFVTNDHLSIFGRLSWRASIRSGWSAGFSSHSDAADSTGDASGTYVPGSSALSTLALTANIASGIVSGTFYVRKVA